MSFKTRYPKISSQLFNVLKYSKLGIFIALFLFFLIGGLSRIRFQTELLDLLPQQLQSVQGLKHLFQYFGLSSELILTIECSDPLRAQALALSLAEELNQHPQWIKRADAQPIWETRPSQLAECLAYFAINQPPEKFQQLLKILNPQHAASTLHQTLDRLTYSFSGTELLLAQTDPYGILTCLSQQNPELFQNFHHASEFTSPNGQLRLIYVEAAADVAAHLTHYQAAQTWMTHLSSLIEHWKAQQSLFPSFTVGQTGDPAFLAEISTTMENDLRSSALSTCALVGLLFWAVYRRITLMLILLLLLILSFASALALGGWILGNITVMSIGFAAILVGLNVDYGLMIYQHWVKNRLNKTASDSGENFAKSSQPSTAQHLLSSTSDPSTCILSIPLAPSLQNQLQHLQHTTTPGIFWAALTTAIAFFSLQFSGVPGLQQLGWLIAWGVLIGAILMVYGFSWAIVRYSSPRYSPDSANSIGSTSPKLLKGPWKPAQHSMSFLALPFVQKCGLYALLASLVAAAVILALHGWPKITLDAHAIQLKNSLATQTSERITTALTGSSQPLYVVITGQNSQTVAQHLESLQQSLQHLQSPINLLPPPSPFEHPPSLITSFFLPTSFWPQEEYQKANLQKLATLLPQRAQLQATLLAQGFTIEAFQLTNQLFDYWAAWEATLGSDGSLTSPIWVQEPLSRWIFRRFIHFPTAALGTVQLAPTVSLAEFSAAWKTTEPPVSPSSSNIIPQPSPPASPESETEISAPHSGVAWVSWSFLGLEMAHFASQEMIAPLSLFGAALLLMLIVAFRNTWDVILALSLLGCNGLLLLGTMSLLNLEWNFMNLAVLVLLLGTGIDYSIHMIFSLRSTQGNSIQSLQTIGTALLLCGLTTVIGFGSLCFSAHRGLSSLGAIAALGFLGNTFLSLFLLPPLWIRIHRVSPQVSS